MLYYIGLSILSNNEKLQKKQSSAEARRILSHFENRNISENDFLIEAGGRPYFADKDTDFNISHSGNAIAVSYIRNNNIRVGCDIEKIKPRINISKIAKDKFSVSENNYLYSDGIFSNINFIKLWTLKESYIKLRGLSVFDMANIPSFIKENKNEKTFNFSFCENVEKILTFRLYELSNNTDIESEKANYFLAEAIEGEYLKPQIVWLSPSSLTLDCKMIAEIKAVPKPAHTVSPNK